MNEYIEWVKKYVRELDNLLATGEITIKKYWDECYQLCEDIDEKIREIQGNRTAFDKMLGDPLKKIGGWFQ